MATQAERLTALETRVDELSELLKQTAQPFPARNVRARWLEHVKYAPKPDGKCATGRCGTKIDPGTRAYYVPKGCGSGHTPGLYCEPCGKVLAGEA